MKTHKIVRSLGVALLVGSLLAGCGEEFPTLTQEEYDLIVNYSAGVLSKYTTGNGDKLTRVAPEEPEEETLSATTVSTGSAATETSSQAATAAVSEETGAASAEDTTEDIDEAETGTTGAASDGNSASTADAEDGAAAATASSDSAQTGASAEEGASESAAETVAQENAVEIGNNDLLQKMQSGVAVDFNGYYVLNSYPDNASGGMVLTADAGNKLLILSFTLVNETGSSIDINFLNANPAFTLLLNGQPVSRNLVTLLDNDMSTYSGVLAGGASTGVVLCFQVKESQAKSIDTLNLRMNYHGEEQVLRIE